MLLLDEARRRHHRGDGVADPVHQLRIVLLHHVVERRAAAGGHVAALARDLLGLLRLIIGRGVRAQGDLHRPGKAQLRQRDDHLAHAHAAELPLDGWGEAGVDLPTLADVVDHVADHGDVGDGAERAGDRAVAAGDALAVVDGRAAVLLVHGDGVHRAGAHAGTARIGDGVVGAGLRAHAALAALVRVNDRALMRHDDRVEAAGLHAALGHAVLAVAGDGVALQRAALAGAVDDGDRLVGEVVVLAVVDGGAAAGPVHAVAQNLALAVDAAAVGRLTAVRNELQRNVVLVLVERALEAVLGHGHQGAVLHVDAFSFHQLSPSVGGDGVPLQDRAPRPCAFCVSQRFMPL